MRTDFGDLHRHGEPVHLYWDDTGLHFRGDPAGTHRPPSGFPLLDEQGARVPDPVARRPFDYRAALATEPAARPQRLSRPVAAARRDAIAARSTNLRD
jgi:hypothetical protein